MITKYILALLLISFTLGPSNPALAQAKSPYFKGHANALGGGISLAGFLKKLLVPNAIPVGRIASFYGYEVWDFTDAKKAIGGHNRATFCFSTLEMTQDLSVLGVAFGGEGSYIRPVGQCPKDLSAVAGEDLIFSIAYDAGKGTKAMPMGISFSYGFDLGNFTEKMLGHLRVNNPNKRTPSERMWRLNTHLLKYLSMKGTRKILTPTQSVLLKLFTSTSLISKENGLKSLMFAEDELDFLSKIATAKVTSFSKELRLALREISKDAKFYNCKDYFKCEEIYVDFLQFSDALTESMSDCHTIGVNVALLKDFAVSLAPSMKVEVGFGYAVTATDRTFTSNLPTAALAVKEFANHRFKSHSVACEDVTRQTGTNFGSFLSLMGYGKKKK